MVVIVIVIVVHARISGGAVRSADSAGRDRFFVRVPIDENGEATHRRLFIPDYGIAILRTSWHHTVCRIPTTRSYCIALYCASLRIVIQHAML